VVWASRWLGRPLPERVAGIDLMERLLAACESLGLPVYFLGAREEVVQEFGRVCLRRFPGLTVSGMHDGYFSDDEAVARQIAASGARVLFVAMPSPRKELFVTTQAEALGEVFAMGVGGSFDVWTGLTTRAPEWMQTAGLEWLFRVAQEPRRMWRRYLFGNVRFLQLTLRERSRQKRTKVAE